MLIVSHDRHFLDRLVDHLFVFCGDGLVKDFVGNYTEYRSFLRDQRSDKAAESGVPLRSERQGTIRSGASPDSAPVAAKKKLKWKEQRELETLEAELSALQEEKSALEAVLSGGSGDMDAIMQASRRIGEVIALIDEKETRWLELSV